ncbi:MAG: DUF4390 domain-containing protein [Nitrospinota bacterium]|nr:DUF4390 domain-containing protein [Nitrospinota bacterium]
MRSIPQNFKSSSVGSPKKPWKKLCSTPGNFSSTTRNTKKSRFGALLVCGILLFARAAAAEPAIVNIEVSTKKNIVTMGALLVNGFSKNILEAINNGIPMTFTYTVELWRTSPLWIDNLVDHNTISNTVQYDSLKKAYRLSSVGRGVKRKVITHDINRLRQLMLRLKDIPVASMRRLDEDQQYYVRVKADLETDRFWFPFNYIFFFVPFNDVKTAWAESSPLVWKANREMAAGPTNRKASRKKSRSPKVLDHVIRTFN